MSFTVTVYDFHFTLFKIGNHCNCIELSWTIIILFNLHCLSLLTIFIPLIVYSSPRSTFHQARSFVLPSFVWAHTPPAPLFSFTPSTALSGVPLSYTPGYWSVGFPRAILGPVTYWHCSYLFVYITYSICFELFFPYESVSNTDLVIQECPLTYIVSGVSDITITRLFTPKATAISRDSDVKATGPYC